MLYGGEDRRQLSTDSGTRPGSLGETLERLNEWLWNVLLAVGRDAPTVYILFDELDAGFDLASDDYVDRVIGLLLAVRKLSREFQDSSLPFHAIAFLRGDIYDSLHFGDKNKLTDKNVTYLAWNDDLNYRGCSLKQLIDHRVREAIDLSQETRDPWARAFDDDVMRGTQHKFNHMTFRSYLRPRDIIKFANCALNEYKQRLARVPANGTGSLSLMSNSDIISARKEYSRYLLSELDDEIAATTPRWNDYMEVLRQIQATRFTRQTFDEAYARVVARVSIIGFERSAGASGLEHHFRYLDETISFNPDARSFMVHRGLKEALELRETGVDALDSQNG
jgi:hypothetical protein